MNIMSIKDALELISYFKRIYPNDYKDIRITHGGVIFTKTVESSKKYYYMSDLEEDINNAVNLYKNEAEYTAFTIDGNIVLNEYELLDICTINIHCPINVYTVPLDRVIKPDNDIVVDIKNLSWSSVFNSQTIWPSDFHQCRDHAKSQGYNYFAFNGEVYPVTTESVNVSIGSDLELGDYKWTL